MNSSRPQGVLFDVDGTLIDSTYLHTIAWWYAFSQQDHIVQMAEVHRSIGMGSDKLISHLMGDDHPAELEDTLSTAHSTIYSTYTGALRPFAGAADLLRSCSEAGLRVVLASSADQHELKTLRQVLDADEWIDAATSSADAQASKPAPDILQAALEGSGLEAQDVLFVGDSVWDVKAAARLDIACIGLECGGTSGAELRKAGAVEVYEGPADLLAKLQESALGRLLRADRS